jgi:hypothetical protein
MLRKRSDWSRPLPQPLQILDENDKPIITLKTLGDVRKMLLGLPEPFQLKPTWGHVALMLDEAARGGDIMDTDIEGHSEAAKFSQSGRLSGNARLRLLT